MELLFSEYTKLRRELEDKGGVHAVVENPGSELEEIYKRSLVIEDEILIKFGLPKSVKYREIIWDLTSESDAAQIINELTKAAEEWLTSSPRLRTELLEEAKKADLKTYEVSPEVGINDDYYSIFYFEQCFKKGIISAQKLLDILDSIDEEIAVKISNLRHYFESGTNLAEGELIFYELSEKKIPYLEELINWELEYPY